MSQMALDIGPGQFVRAINKGEHELTIRYNRMKYKLEPEKERLIPWEAAQLWFGDPRTSAEMKFIENEDGSKQMLYPRQAEVRRLRAKYGNLEGQSDETIVPNCPTVEIYTGEGHRVVTVLEDPKGETSNPALISRADDTTTANLLKKQQKQIDMLMKELQKSGKLEEIEDAEEEGLVSIQTGELPADDE